MAHIISSSEFMYSYLPIHLIQFGVLPSEEGPAWSLPSYSSVVKYDYFGDVITTF